MKKVFFAFLLTVICFFAAPSLLHAQDFPDDPDETDVPLDGGVSLLVAAAIAYSTVKAYEQRQR